MEVLDVEAFLGGVAVLTGVRAEEREEGNSTTGIERRVFVWIGDDDDPACCDTDLAREARGVLAIV